MRKSLLLLVLMLVLLLAACAPGNINYQGKVRPVDEAEEMIEDQLEAENVAKDYEVSIVEETEDDTKKKKKKKSKTTRH